MSCDVTMYADTSSRQAINNPGQRRCVYSNLSKIVIKSVAAKRVAVMFVAVRDLAGKFRFPILSERLLEQSKLWPCAS